MTARWPHLPQRSRHEATCVLYARALQTIQNQNAELRELRALTLEYEDGLHEIAVVLERLGVIDPLRPPADMEAPIRLLDREQR